MRKWKEVVAIGLGCALALVLGEIAARAYFSFNVGPRVLLYGSDWYRNVERTGKKPRLSEGEQRAAAEEWARKDSVEIHANDLGGYSKFFPGETKTTRDVDTGERIAVTINRHGLRGRDFAHDKAPGTIRVLTMGSSSTVGYYNRDEETYPYQLERLLQSRCGGKLAFEVINFAVPHATSSNVAAMFVAEGLRLTPDVVTFYEGRNDSVLSRQYDGPMEKAYSVLVHRLLLVAFLDQALVGERLSVTDSSLQLGPIMEERSRVFIANLDVIREAAQRAGATLIVANQQSTSSSPLPRASQERLALRGVTYAQEVGAIRGRLDATREVSPFESSLLVHHRLMSDLEQWSRRHDVAFVDVIGALDQDRHHLLSWVHLHPEANRVVAAKLAEPILRQFCPTAAGRFVPVPGGPARLG